MQSGEETTYAHNRKPFTDLVLLQYIGPRSLVILGFFAGRSGDCSALLTLFIRDADRAGGSNTNS